MRKEAIQYITATLAAFGPDEAISMTKETWSKLREAMKALADQPAQQRTEELLEIFKDVDQCGPLLGMGQPAQQCKWPTCQSEKYQQALAEQIKRELVGEQPAQQEPVTSTAVEMQNAAANLALMREMWGNADEPAAKVNDDGFIVETGLLLSPGTKLYTSPPAQRTWVGLTPEELDEMFSKTLKGKKLVNWVARAIEAKLKEKNNG